MENILPFLGGAFLVICIMAFYIYLNAEKQRYKYFKNLFTAVIIFCFLGNIGYGVYCMNHFLASENPLDKKSIYDLVLGMTNFSITFVLIPIFFLANKIVGLLKLTAEVIDGKL